MLSRSVLSESILGTLAEGIACRRDLGLCMVESLQRTGPRIDKYWGGPPHVPWERDDQLLPQRGAKPCVFHETRLNDEDGTQASTGQIAHNWVWLCY